MKLAFLIYNYFPYGGQQRDFYRIAQECLQHGHDVNIYTMKWQGEQIRNATIHFAPISSISRTRLYRKFTTWVRKELIASPCDVVIGFNKMPGLDIYFAADPCFAEKAEKQRGFYYRFTPRYWHFKNYEHAVFNSAAKTKVLILSPLQRVSFQHYYPGCSPRLHLMPPGIDRERMTVPDSNKVREKIREEFGIGNHELFVVQIGSGFRIKGVDRSLRAIASLPLNLRSKVKFLLVGQDKPGYFEKLAKQLGVSDLFIVSPGRDDKYCMEQICCCTLPTVKAPGIHYWRQPSRDYQY
jgi:UDP-glucose:(heptosyl)LPS alpha-1,3-glucosyltransferase